MLLPWWRIPTGSAPSACRWGATPSICAMPSAPSSTVVFPASACNPKVAATLAVVFLAGGAVGALTMQMGLHERLHRTVSAASTPERKAPTNDALVQRFKTELNLSAAQTDQIGVGFARGLQNLLARKRNLARPRRAPGGNPFAGALGLDLAPEQLWTA